MKRFMLSALFSLGHGGVVLAIAVVVSLIAQGWAVPAWAEDLGTWISIGFLTALGVVNLRSVWLTPAGEVVQPVGLKGRWLAGLPGCCFWLRAATYGGSERKSASQSGGSAKLHPGKLPPAVWRLWTGRAVWSPAAPGLRPLRSSLRPISLGTSSPSWTSASAKF